MYVQAKQQAHLGRLFTEYEIEMNKFLYHVQF